MDYSSAASSCSSEPSIFSYPFVPEPYSLTDSMIFDDHVAFAKIDCKNPYFSFPISLGTPSSTTTHTMGLLPRRHSTPFHTNASYNANFQIDAADGQMSQVFVEGDFKRRSTVEETTKRRREQNRASQRAYRERRDRHIEDLEERNRFLQQNASALLDENQRLRRQLSHLLNNQSRVTSNSTGTSSVSPTSSTLMLSLPNTIQYEKDILGGNDDWEAIQDQ